MLFNNKNDKDIFIFNNTIKGYNIVLERHDLRWMKVNNVYVANEKDFSSTAVLNMYISGEEIIIYFRKGNTEVRYNRYDGLENNKSLTIGSLEEVILSPFKLDTVNRLVEDINSTTLTDEDLETIRKSIGWNHIFDGIVKLFSKSEYFTEVTDKDEFNRLYMEIKITDK